MADLIKNQIEKKNKYVNLERCIQHFRKEQEDEIKMNDEQQRILEHETSVAMEEDLAREINKQKREEMRELRLR